MRENRREPRKRIKEWAKIVLEDERTVFNCTIADLSAHGACLKIGTAVLPDRFLLFRKADQTLREATVKSRRFQTVGVELSPPLSAGDARVKASLDAINARKPPPSPLAIRRAERRQIFRTALHAFDKAV